MQNLTQNELENQMLNTFEPSDIPTILYSSTFYNWHLLIFKYQLKYHCPEGLSPHPKENFLPILNDFFHYSMVILLRDLVSSFIIT